MTARPHPWFDFLALPGEAHAEAIRAAIGAHPTRAAFLLDVSALEFLEALQPEGGSGEQIDDLVDLAWSAWRFRIDGSITRSFDESLTRALVGPGPVQRPIPVRGRTAWYIQLAERVIWGKPSPDGAFEPLDGGFLVHDGGELLMVACFGVHPDRPGFSIATAHGPRPGRLSRADGTALFAPTMPGGAEAGLHAIMAPEELLLLGWRALSTGGTD